jgi:hypothetical protein
MPALRKSPVLWILALSAIPGAQSQTPACTAPVATTCSSTAMNNDCTVGIDRLRAVTPPTINVHRGSVITLSITDTTPFEQLSLDLKSATAQVPADQWQAAFTALSPIAQKLMVAVPFEAHGITGDTVDKIKTDQVALAIALARTYQNAAIALALIKSATQAPPTDICSAADDPSSPWLHTAVWKTAVQAALSEALKVYVADGSSSFNTTIATAAIADLATRIAVAAPSKADSDALTANQTSLTSTVTGIKAALAKLALVKKVIDDPFIAPLTTPTIKTITDLKARKDSKSNKLVLDDRNDLNEQWTLNFVNTFAPKILAALSDPTDPFSSSVADLKATPPAKNALLTITALYQTPPHLEVAAGLMIPMRPFHSYASSGVSSSGAITNYVVQETRTYTVVPVAEFNIVLHDFLSHGSRAAFFATIATGYNPTSSAVEFGVGPSFGWKSMLFSGLVDFGRDTELSGGFSVGQSLGASGSSIKPTTSIVWKAKPAAGISVRIPLPGK